MSYFQLPPGFSSSACFGPLYVIGGSLIVLALVKFVVKEVVILLRGAK